MEYNIQLESFEGPLDVLLYLLKKADIKIEEISIEKITEQYLSFINKMEQINLNIASEYLVMAAELIEMKSYVLLPKKEIEEEEIEDPREKLIKRLLEYKVYKEVTKEFKKLEEIRREIHTKEPSDLTEYKSEEEIIQNSDINLLIEALKSVLERKELSEPIDTKITTKEYSIQKRNKEIKELLRKNKKIEFKELFDIFNKDYIIITFLSILDLSKKQEIEIIQDNNFDNIILVNKGDK